MYFWGENILDGESRAFRSSEAAATLVCSRTVGAEFGIKIMKSVMKRGQAPKGT